MTLASTPMRKLMRRITSAARSAAFTRARRLARTIGFGGAVGADRVRAGEGDEAKRWRER